MQNLKLKFKIFLGAVAVIIILLAGAVFLYPVPQKDIAWGVNFSQMQAESLKLDWKKTYLAILGDLGVKNLKLLIQWDWVEGEKGAYYFDDIDWQVSQAENHGAGIIYVLGMKTGRWPECHVPTWANTVSKQDQQDAILQYITRTVERYKNSKAIVAWQAENEPLFNFGECPWYDKEFLKKEVALIKQLDPSRPVIVSDTGDQSLWIEATKMADILGITMYRKVWMHITDNFGFYVTYPYPPKFYGIKADMMRRLSGKKIIVVEYQAEPWNSEVFYNVPLEEQEKSMNLEQFKSNITFAQRTGIDQYYWWGVEWWFWLKEMHNKPEIWNEAKKLF